MTEAVCTQKKPYALELEAGDYWWCACGRSATQPFCDGSHKTTEFRPVQFTATATEAVAFCGCKHTGTQPRCDGTHKQYR